MPAPPPLDPSWIPYDGSAPDDVPLVVRRRVMSPELRNFRDLVAALPPSYLTAPERTYPVVYMQDGQNLFDPATSHAGDWGLPARLAALAGRGIETIVVGVPNQGEERVYEYGPFQDARHGGGGGDRYATFLAETVRPLVLRTLRARPGPQHAVVAGSSLGGLISLYTLLRFREHFGAAGVLSPSLWFADRAMLGWVGRWGARVARGRIHLDVGTGEGTDVVANVRAMRDILERAGYRRGRDLQYVEEKGATHAEAAWGRRFGDALPFLLGRTRPPTATPGH
jgi:isoamylase